MEIELIHYDSKVIELTLTGNKLLFYLPLIIPREQIESFLQKNKKRLEEHLFGEQVYDKLRKIEQFLSGLKCYNLGKVKPTSREQEGDLLDKREQFFRELKRLNQRKVKRVLCEQDYVKVLKSIQLYIELEHDKTRTLKQLLRDIAREIIGESFHMLTEEEIKDLSRKARKVIQERAAYYAPIIGVNYARIMIRRKTENYWGRCSNEGMLNFKFLLILMPPEVIDYVVVHELCHLKIMDHSDSFYAEVLRVIPNYRELEKWLYEKGTFLNYMLED